MAKRRGSNKQIEVSQDFAGSPQSSTVLAEDFTSLCIDTQRGDTQEKIVECLRIPRWVGGIVHTLIQFREGDDGHGAPLIAQGLQPAYDGAMAVQVMDYPIRVDEIAEGHRAGMGRVSTTRSV